MSSSPPFEYKGTELGTFATARVWKEYLRSHIRPYTQGEVMEVGAGIGSTTEVLGDDTSTRWVCVEPDPELASVLSGRIVEGTLPASCQVVNGTIQDAPGSFDCILYIDVLEHIEHDRSELRKAAARLRSNGYLVVLSPAHPWLFTPFDRAIGHWRRYTRRMLADIAPTDVRMVRSIYLDSVGMLASLANRFLLRSSEPSEKQVAFWDRVLVRLSRSIDPLLRYRVGKSVLVIWQKS